MKEKNTTKIIIFLFIIISLLIIIIQKVNAVDYDRYMNNVTELYNDDGVTTVQCGIRFQATSSVTLLQMFQYDNITSDYPCLTANLYDDTFNLLDTQSFTGIYANFTYPLISGQYYYASCSDGETHRLWDKLNPALPINSTHIKIVGGNIGLTYYSNYVLCIQNITTGICQENWIQYNNSCNGYNFTKYYIDNSSCGTSNTIPIDNNTQYSCFYDNQNIEFISPYCEQTYNLQSDSYIHIDWTEAQSISPVNYTLYVMNDYEIFSNNLTNNISFQYWYDWNNTLYVGDWVFFVNTTNGTSSNISMMNCFFHVINASVIPNENKDIDKLTTSIYALVLIILIAILIYFVKSDKND